MVESISMSQLKELLGGIKLIDIRPIVNYNNNHIPGAQNIPQTKLLLEPEKYLNKFDTYYIYCQRGHASANVVSILNNSGYKTVNVEGGYERWILMN